MARVLLLVLVSVVFAPGTTAWAQPAGARPAQDAAANKAKAKAHYDRAQTHFNLAEFDEAINEYGKAYANYSDPVFLFNIAQAQRLKGEIEKAIFMYGRYLKEKPEALNRKDVEGFVAGLEAEKVRRASGGAGTGAGGAGTGGAGAGGAGGAGAAGAGGEHAGSGSGSASGSALPTRPGRLALSIGGGPVLVNFKGLPEGTVGEQPPEAALAVEGAYTILPGTPWLTLVVRTGYTQVGWRRPAGTVPVMGAMVDGDFWLVDVLGGVAMRRRLGARFSLGATVAVGATVFGGLEFGNPFTTGGQAYDSAVSVPSGVASIDAEFRLSRSLAVAVTPMAFSLAGRYPGMAMDWTQRLAAFVGLTYRP